MKRKILRENDTVIPFPAVRQLHLFDYLSEPDSEVSALSYKHKKSLKAQQTERADEQGFDETAVGQSESNRTASGAYRQDWTLYNTAQTNELPHFQRMLWTLCRSVGEPRQYRGRPRLEFCDMLFLIVYRAYFSQFSGRRFTSQLEQLKEKGYISRVPHFNSLFNYLELVELTEALRNMLIISSLPLVPFEEHFSPDSSGFSTKKFNEWKQVKYGNTEKWREWVKLHVMCGKQTRIITAVEITPEYAHDSPHFESLLRQTQKYFDVREVSADKGYSSYYNVELIVSAGALAFIMFKDNARGDTKNEIWNRVFHYFSLHKEEFLKFYHQRSNVETLFSVMKAKFGERLRSKVWEAQVNELLCKCICHNLCCLIKAMFEFGIEPTDFFTR